MKKQPYLFSALLFVAVTVTIILMIPHSGRYLERFTLGDPWKGETLTAPFDFSISKSEAEVAEDRQRTRRSYIPVYSLDEAVLPGVLTAVSQQLQREAVAGADGEPAVLPHELEAALTHIYSKGLVSGLDHSFVDSAGDSFVRINREGVLETLSAQEIFTPAAAQEYLMSRNPDSLLAESWPLLLTPNLTYNQTLNANLQEREQRNVALTRGIVYQNEVIVSKGELIDQTIYNKLNSLETEYRSRTGDEGNYIGSTVGISLFVLILMGATYLYLFFFRKNFLTQKRNVLFILMLYLLMVGLCAAIYRMNALNVYLIPFAIVPIYILTFFDVRTSIFELTVILLLCSLVVPRPLEFILINFVGGVFALFVLGRTYRRARVFLATAAILVSNCVCYLAMTLIQEGGLHDVSPWMLVWFVFSGVLFLGMYQLIYVFEKMFGFVSDITLFELSDTNQKLLQELARQAPGTFQHTLQVANLAEAAAQAIGAKALLARTGALYHDIGKLKNPGFFIENRGSGNNPHDQLTPLQSAEIIRNHVSDGVALAKKQRLPAIITDFITGHHGDSLIYYFYDKQKKLNGGVEPALAQFRYDSAKPTAKEVSICMMADAVEAASRSLPEYTEESIDALVDRIVNTQIREGALQCSQLSFHDVGLIKEVFKKYLCNIYHTRISYPDRGDAGVGTPAMGN
ncbi:MAG: HDIG domain-containing protein [Rikenellaceae bacterium]|nr:HDIG domain-containing protein [Rikenellaceae bacterium]